MKHYDVTLRRPDGHAVKSTRCPSKYAAKRLARFWRNEHPASYYVEIVLVA